LVVVMKQVQLSPKCLRIGSATQFVNLLCLLVFFVVNRISRTSL
jgi:hypothetical protein